MKAKKKIKLNILFGKKKIYFNFFLAWHQSILLSTAAKVCKVGDLIRGRPEGSFFNSYYTEV